MLCVLSSGIVAHPGVRVHAQETVCLCRLDVETKRQLFVRIYSGKGKAMHGSETSGPFGRDPRCFGSYAVAKIYGVTSYTELFGRKTRKKKCKLRRSEPSFTASSNQEYNRLLLILVHS